jgi:hypothetical protein
VSPGPVCSVSRELRLASAALGIRWGRESAVNTRTAGSLGIVDGSDLRILFDANESGGDSIDLEALRLLILDPTTGGIIFQAELGATRARWRGGCLG